MYDNLMQKKPKNDEESKIVELLKRQADAILNVPLSNPYKKTLSLIHDTIANNGHIFITGVGKAGDVGRKVASTFNSTGIPSSFLSPLDAAHGDLGAIRKEDLLFAISNSGKTTEILNLIIFIRRAHPKTPVICLTGNPLAPIAKTANLVLFTGSPKEICPLGLTPTSSVIAMLTITDILTVLSMRQRGFSPKEYYLRHHNGYLGSKAKQLTKKAKTKK